MTTVDSDRRTVSGATWHLEYREDDSLWAVETTRPRWWRRPVVRRLLVTENIIRALSDVVDMSGAGLARAVLTDDNRRTFGIPDGYGLRDDPDDADQVQITVDGEPATADEVSYLTKRLAGMVHLGLHILAEAALTPEGVESLEMVNETPALRSTYLEGLTLAGCRIRDVHNTGVDDRAAVDQACADFLEEQEAAIALEMAASDADVLESRRDRLQMLMASGVYLQRDRRRR